MDSVCNRKKHAFNQSKLQGRTDVLVCFAIILPTSAFLLALVRANYWLNWTECVT